MKGNITYIQINKQSHELKLLREDE